MQLVPQHHRYPTAGVDPIDSPDLALHVVTRSMHVPPRHETIVVLLDDARCGLAIVSISDTVHPDAVFDVVELLARPEVADGRVGAMIVASIRPGGGPLADDGDRWLELCALTDDEGIDLVEWFVLGATTSCPRDLLGVRPRW